MYSKESKVNFSMSYAELAGVSKQRANTIMRDIAEFENYGIKAAEIAAFKAKVVEFDKMRIDEDYRGLVMQATQDKDVLAKQIRSNIRTIAMFVKRAYNTQTGAYARLKLGKIAQISDLKLYRTTNSFCRIVRALDIPLTDTIVEHLSALESENEQFNALIEQKNIKIEERDIATLVRVAMANEIYSQFSDYCNVGQVIWAEQNEAKYNDYVIYGGSPTAPPPENTDGSKNRDDQGNSELPNG